MIEKITHKKKIYAIIIRSKFKKRGIHFFTENKDTFQLGYINYKTNHQIIPHYHPNKKKIVNTTTEALIIKRGIIKVNFFDEKKKKKYFKSKILKKGDIILILRGGHGFTVIKNVEMFEIKQGPFNPKVSKVRVLKK